MDAHIFLFIDIITFYGFVIFFEVFFLQSFVFIISSYINYDTIIWIGIKIIMYSQRMYFHRFNQT